MHTVSRIIDAVEGYTSYDLHTVHGTWMIIITVIVAVFILLMLLRLVAPVKGDTVTEEMEIEELVSSSATIMENGGTASV